ncbi:MAG: hypothetical protein AAGI01_05120, partial [Myxococcota bacterium]
MDEDGFGALRSALHQTPGSSSWEQLTVLLEQWSPDELDERFSHYLAGALARWPDAVRRVPERWLVRAGEGAPAPYMRWARAAELGRARGYALESVLVHDALRALTHLSVSGCGIDGYELAALTREEGEPRAPQPVQVEGEGSQLGQTLLTRERRELVAVDAAPRDAQVR